MERIGDKEVNIIEALEANGIDYRKGSRSFEFKICCPFCPDTRGEIDTEFKFGFNIQTGQAHCFHAGCNRSFHSAGMHAIIEKLELGELVEIQKKVKEKRKVNFQDITLPEGYEKLRRPLNKKIEGDDAEFYLKKAYRYARFRGLTDEQIKEKKVGYAEWGEFKYRLIFPVIYKSKLHGVVGRDFTESQMLKYKNSEGIKAIYNIPENRADEAVLTEGVLDALAIERAMGDKYIDSLAVLGASLSSEQLKMLKGYHKFYLWPDPDRGGVKAFLRMVPLLQEIGEVHWVFKNGEVKRTDPSDMTKEEIRFQLEQSQPYNIGVESRMRAWLAFDEET